MLLFLFWLKSIVNRSKLQDKSSIQHQNFNFHMDGRFLAFCVWGKAWLGPKGNRNCPLAPDLSYLELTCKEARVHGADTM